MANAEGVSNKSIVINGILLELDGDLVSPGLNRVYGTDENGDRGWLYPKDIQGVQHSVEYSGSGKLQLDGDQTSPGNSKYYGTDSSGTKGFHAMPSDPPWTTLVNSSDINATSTTAVDITDLAFTPEANKQYEIEAKILVQSGGTGQGARIGVQWPTGYLKGAVLIAAVNKSTSTAIKNITAGTDDFNTAGEMPSANEPYLVIISGILTMDASPSGDFQLDIRAENGSHSVWALVGSVLKYRELN